jgi:cytoskeletal protein CcmA (bactofilin family)
MGVCEIRNGYDSGFADLRVKNLFITGSQTEVQSETINLADNIITLNSNFTSGQPVENAGIEIARGDLAKASLIWDESVDKWKCGLAGTETEISLLGHDHPNITGNAATASKLKDPRIIALSGDVGGSVAFDGSADVTIDVVAYRAQKLTTARSISLSGDATGTTAFDGSANVTIPVTIMSSQKLTTPRMITIAGDLSGATAFDGSSNITITCSVARANKLTTARQIALAGDITGSVMFDGTSNVTINTTGGATAKLTTARNITINGAVTGNALFDGSSDITIATALTTHSHADATLTNISWSKILNVPAASAATPNYLCQRDANGDVWARYFRGIATSALYGDVAELYTAKNPVFSVGQVVLVSPEKGYDCELSNEEGSDRILGIVSEKPGFVLRDGLPDGTAIMRVGVGNCQVQGPVEKGEPLISGLGGTAIGSRAYLRKNPGVNLSGRILARANDTITDNAIKLIEVIM